MAAVCEVHISKIGSFARHAATLDWGVHDVSQAIGKTLSDVTTGRCYEHGFTG